jgi:glycosyltransferase involved in cell wall biosynthesis
MEGFCEKTTWPVSRAWVVPNGIVPEYYRTDDHVFREGKRLIYTSTPFRGLMHLSYLFPEIQRRVPDAELHICGGMAVYQDHNSEYDRTYEAFTGMDGVTLHGSLGQRALATEMEKCRVLAYPNTFPETCCTTAYEAMAAGLVIVTSDRAGLTDTVGSNGVLIEGEPGTEQYTTAFVDACVHYLEEDNQWGLEARKAWAWAHNNRTWDVLAQTWIDNLELIQQKG